MSAMCPSCGAERCDPRCPAFLPPDPIDLARMVAEYESLDRPWWADRLMTHVRTDMPEDVE